MATRKRDRFLLYLERFYFGNFIGFCNCNRHGQYAKKSDAPKDSTTTSTSQTTNKEDKKMLQGTQLSGFTPVASIAQLRKIDTVPGTDQEVKTSDTVTVDYTGAVAATGVIFQSSF